MAVEKEKNRLIREKKRAEVEIMKVGTVLGCL
jgi:hypothetical protein